MSDEKHIKDFDLMMKSILDEAREEVPERVWDRVSSGLDKAARKKVVVLWWRRAAAGVAVAAVVALGVFFSFNGGDEFVPAATDGDMIAVVKPVEDYGKEDGQETVLMAEAEEVAVVKKSGTVIPETAAEAIEISDEPEKVVETEDKTEKSVDKVSEQVEYFPEDWGEDEERRDGGISFVLSGIAGTNNALSQNGLIPMKRPVVTPAPKASGIEETSPKSSYGIPLSFGAGVKFGLGPRWSIGTGLNYTLLMRQFYGTYREVSNGVIKNTVSSDIRNKQHFIGIPVNFYYDVINNDKINFYAYAGGTAEKCLSDSYSLMKTSIVHKEKAEGIQLSANAGIGVEFMLGRDLGLYIDPSIRYYFENDQPKSIRTVQPLMFGFEIGIRARL